MVDELRRTYNYDKDTGIFSRKILKPGPKGAVGTILGTIDKDGYLTMRFSGKTYKLHRLAWLYVYGEFPDGEIDHMNRVRNDNAINNLRVTTRSENCLNNAGKHICYRKRSKRYEINFRVDGKQKYFGSSKDRDTAIALAEKVRKKLGR